MQADRLARITRGIAIEGEGLDAQIAGTVEFQQLGHLVLCQRLGREQVQRLGLVLHRRADHGQGVAQRLAAGGGGDDGHVLTTLAGLPGLGLVAVELLDAACLQGRGQGRRYRIGNGGIAALAAGNGKAAGDAVMVAALQARAEQGAVTGGQAIAGGELLLGIGGALGEFVSHGKWSRDGLRGVTWHHIHVSGCETSHTEGVNRSVLASRGAAASPLAEQLPVQQRNLKPASVSLGAGRNQQGGWLWHDVERREPSWPACCWPVSRRRSRPRR